MGLKALSDQPLRACVATLVPLASLNQALRRCPAWRAPQLSLCGCTWLLATGQQLMQPSCWSPAMGL